MRGQLRGSSARPDLLRLRNTHSGMTARPPSYYGGEAISVHGARRFIAEFIPMGVCLSTAKGRAGIALTPTCGHPSPARGRGAGGEGHRMGR